jgi:hypothetical protein
VSKFSNDTDAWLYSQDADETEGDSSGGAGWYGLYRAPLYTEDCDAEDLTGNNISFLQAHAGAILFERADGIVESEYYETSESLDAAWAEIAQAHEMPDEDGGDYTTNDHVRFFQFHKRVVTVEGDADWRDAVKAHMDAEQFWPNVWFISDHGNVEQLSLEAK